MMKTINLRLLNFIVLLLSVCTPLSQGELTLWQIVAIQGGSNQWTSITVIRDGSILKIDNRDLHPDAEPITLNASDVVAFGSASETLLKWKVDHPDEVLTESILATLPKSQLFRADGSRLDRVLVGRPLPKTKDVPEDSSDKSPTTQPQPRTQGSKKSRKATPEGTQLLKSQSSGSVQPPIAAPSGFKFWTIGILIVIAAFCFLWLSNKKRGSHR